MMKTNYLGIALIILSIGVVLLGALGKPGVVPITLVILALGIFATLMRSWEEPDPSIVTNSDIVLDALSTASDAIHAFEDAEGIMPKDTGEFSQLQRAGYIVDRAIDRVMVVM